MFHPGTTTLTRNRNERRGRRNGTDPKQTPSRLVHDMNRLSMQNQIPIPYKAKSTFGNEADDSKYQSTSKKSRLEKDEATKGTRKIHRVRRLQRKGGKHSIDNLGSSFVQVNGLSKRMTVDYPTELTFSNHIFSKK